MRVLWLVNIMLPAYAKAKGLPYSVREGWLSGSFDRISKDIKLNNDIKNNKEDSETAMPKNQGSLVELGVAFPFPDGAVDNTGVKPEIIDGVSFYKFNENLNTPEIYDEQLESEMKSIIDNFRPDIIHIFGTEFPHTLAMTRAFNRSDRTLIGIQGICNVIADKYLEGLPESVKNAKTFRDRIKKDSLQDQVAKYRLRGQNETEAIRNAGHITGRTDFDREETARINPDAQYHFMNETMRDIFYKPLDADARSHVRPYSIMLSQGDYPLKGFHYVLEALPEIIKVHPETKLYVAGNSIVGNIDRSEVIGDTDGAEYRGSRYPFFLRASAYGKYLRKLIRDNNLQDHVVVLGKLSAEQMKDQMLRSSIFVCPSTVENSPNSLAEAMLLGVPVVAARTGGIPSMVTDGREGYLFEPGNIEEFTKAILNAFDEKVITDLYCENAKKRAFTDHDADTNFNRLIEIYRDIYNG